MASLHNSPHVAIIYIIISKLTLKFGAKQISTFIIKQNHLKITFKHDFTAQTSL